jgi:squalene cyclase
MQTPSTISYEGWTSAHPCVTAVAATIESFGELLAQYLWRSQKTDGSWPAYWWVDREYATGLAILALHRRSGSTPASASRLRKAVQWAESQLAMYLEAKPEGSLPPAFPIACCLKGVAIAQGSHALIVKAITRLVDMQSPDGSWSSSARLRVPPTHCLNPNRIRTWQAEGRTIRSVSLDRRRAFTTSTVLNAVSTGIGRLAALGG